MTLQSIFTSTGNQINSSVAVNESFTSDTSL